MREALREAVMGGPRTQCVRGVEGGPPGRYRYRPESTRVGAASLHPGEARVGLGAHSGGVRPRFSLRC